MVGIQKVTGDVELIASVPFQVIVKREQVSNKELTTEEAGIAWTFSTFDLDRYYERIDPAGWDFSWFMKNPVVEWAHRYDIPAIGRADNLYIDENGLHGKVVFND
jgi:hypothetical protein